MNRSVMEHAKCAALTAAEIENNRKTNETLGERPEKVGAAVGHARIRRAGGMMATNIYLDKGARRRLADRRGDPGNRHRQMVVCELGA